MTVRRAALFVPCYVDTLFPETGVPPDTIRGWVDRTRVDGGERLGVTTAEQGGRLK